MASAQIGIALALVAAVMANLSSCSSIAAARAYRPSTSAGRWQSARGLARSRWFVAGWGLAAVAWLIHVASLSMAPISLVQAVARRRRRDPGGDVAAAVRQPVERRQWLALFLGGAGLALLAVTVPQFSGSHSEFAVGADPRLRGRAGADRGGAGARPPLRAAPPHRGVLLAILAGTLFALAGVAIKGLTGAAGLGVADHRRLGRDHRPLRHPRPVHGGLGPAARRRDRDDRADGPGRQRDPDSGRRPRLRRPPLLRSARRRPPVPAFAMVCASALLLPAADRAAPPALQPIAS